MTKISELPATAFPSLQHLIPAARGDLGETHGLTLAQLKTLFAYTAAEITRGGGSVEDALSDLENLKADESWVLAEFTARNLLDAGDKQTNATDNTLGRLLIVGAFGLGRSARQAGATFSGSISGQNTIKPGLYEYNTTNGATGGPTGVTDGTLIHQRRDDGGGETQLLIVTGGGGAYSVGDMLTRGRQTGGWTTWRAAGIESEGSNANGYYVRFTNGYQVCICTVTPGVSPAAGSWPAAFDAVGSFRAVVTPLHTSADFLISAQLGQKSTTGYSVRAYDNVRDGTGYTVSCEVIAFGRWR